MTRRTAFLALALAPMAAACGGKDTKPPPFHKVTDELCFDRGVALIIFAEVKSTAASLRGVITRGCRDGTFDKVTCAELQSLGHQLAPLEADFQEKILNPATVVDVKKVVAALKLIAAIAGKLL